MAVTDTGRSRTFADVQAVAGDKNPRKLAAVSKQVNYLDIGKATASGPNVSHAQLERMIRQHAGLREAVEKVAAVSGIQPHAQIAAVYVLAREEPAEGGSVARGAAAGRRPRQGQSGSRDAQQADLQQGRGLEVAAVWPVRCRVPHQWLERVLGQRKGPDRQ